eukprot:2411078-Pyramimonas_sp.AAC.1
MPRPLRRAVRDRTGGGHAACHPAGPRGAAPRKDYADSTYTHLHCSRHIQQEVFRHRADLSPGLL